MSDREIAKDLVEKLLASTDPEAAVQALFDAASTPRRSRPASPVKRYALTISPQGRSILVSAMRPVLARLIRSGDITSNIFAEEYAQQLAAKMIDTAVAHFED